MQGDGFDLLAEDFNRDGRRDLAAISHGASNVQFFYQQAPRQFVPGPESTLVGFHPGDLLPVAPEQSLYLQLAEGVNALVLFRIGAHGQMDPLSRREESAPRHGAFFRWPGWGLGLAVAPYGQDYLVLYKNVDPLHLETAERFVLPLAAERPSLRNAERLTVADIDGDGIDEILFATVYTNELGVIRMPKSGRPPAATGLLTFADGMQTHVLAEDLNEDGHIDLAVPDTTTPHKLHLLFNDGRGQFSAAIELDVPTTTQGIFRFAAARDADGNLYLLGATTDNLVLYQIPRHWNAVNPPARRVVTMAAPLSTGRMLLRDIDGDGALDAVVGDSLGPWILYGPLWPHFEEMQKDPLIVH